MQIDSTLLESIAIELQVEPASIFAVVSVESNKKFSYANGKIPILFERHWFYKLYLRKHGKQKAIALMKQESSICNKRPGGYTLHGEYERLAKAIAWDKEIAHLSTSFGAFQIMGFNHKLCGYKTATEMANYYHEFPIEEQIKGFMSFVKGYHKGKLLKALQEKDWAEFARRYNGKHYRENNYDNKLRIAYLSYVPEQTKS